ncbi:HNH endonuclease signature motif containing protein [Alistipes finegoldii]|nr:MAG TPA: HNH endonuclease [Caudoviricetes sp.]
MPTIPKPTRRGYLPPRIIQGRRLHDNGDFYRSSRWRRLRLQKLNAEPLCEECRRGGVVTPATVVDHIVPINEGGAPMDMENLQSLCAKCHNRKSGAEAHKSKL